MALHNKKIKARRNQIAALLSKSFNETEIAQHLGVDQSTISRDIKVLKESAQQFVYDLAKSDLAYYYKQSIDGIEEAKKELLQNYSCQMILGRGLMSKYGEICLFASTIYFVQYILF